MTKDKCMVPWCKKEIYKEDSSFCLEHKRTKDGLIKKGGGVAVALAMIGVSAIVNKKIK